LVDSLAAAAAAAYIMFLRISSLRGSFSLTPPSKLGCLVGDRLLGICTNCTDALLPGVQFRPIPAARWTTRAGIIIRGVVWLACGTAKFPETCSESKSSPNLNPALRLNSVIVLRTDMHCEKWPFFCDELLQQHDGMSAWLWNKQLHVWFWLQAFSLPCMQCNK
jgi:hypothetical protein